MTTETKTAAATLRTTGLTIDFIDSEENDDRVQIFIDNDGDLCFKDAVVEKPTREVAFAIAEAFTRLAQELPEAPTND